MKREDRLLKNYFEERVHRVPRRPPPGEGTASVPAETAPVPAAAETGGSTRGPRNRILPVIAYAAMLAAAVLPLLPFSRIFRDNSLARTVTAVYREYGMETRAEEGIERFFLTLRNHLEEEKNL